ncbi:MAG: CBS domain-containing protein [Paracoccaceae bacterium]
MIVKQILKAKPPGPLHVLAPSAGLRDAVALMSKHRIGTVVVSDDGATPAGILSERDVVRELGTRGDAVLDLTVADVMTPDPVTCTPSETVDRALAIMTDGRFRHLPVLEDGTMVGIVSIGDLVKARIEHLEHERGALEAMIVGHG